MHSGRDKRPVQGHCGTSHLGSKTQHIHVSHLIAAVVRGLSPVHKHTPPMLFTPIFDPMPAVEKYSTSIARDRDGATWRWHLHCFPLRYLGTQVSPEWRKCDSRRLLARCLTYFNLHVQKAVSTRPSETGFVYTTFAQVLRTPSSPVSTASKQNGICFTPTSLRSPWGDIAFQAPGSGKMAPEPSHCTGKCIRVCQNIFLCRPRFLTHCSRHLSHG
jgi:hypothetical protein